MAYLEETASQPDGAQEGHDLQDEHKVDAGHDEAVRSRALDPAAAYPGASLSTFCLHLGPFVRPPRDCGIQTCNGTVYSVLGGLNLSS